jgi:hypothetical protein
MLLPAFFFIASGVGLGPLYCGHFWSIVPAPDDRWGWLWSYWWNEDWQGKPKYSEKTCPSTNPNWPDPGSNPGRSGGKPATNRLSYGAATCCWLTFQPSYFVVHYSLRVFHCKEINSKWFTHVQGIAKWWYIHHLVSEEEMSAQSVFWKRNILLYHSMLVSDLGHIQQSEQEPVKNKPWIREWKH